MIQLEVLTKIAAPRDVCFDLARDVEFHAHSMASSSERVVERPLHRLLETGDEVVFEAWHLGRRRRHRARIEDYDRPHSFRDVMVRGDFVHFEHLHSFSVAVEGTLMVDTLRFVAPGGWPGALVGRWLLRPYVARQIRLRGQEIRRRAEQIHGVAREPVED